MNVDEDDNVIDLTTVTTSNKRKKTTPTEGKSTPTISPSERSMSLVLSHLASHPPPIIDLGTTLYKKFAKCMKERDDLKRRIKKLDASTDYISNSMKHNFTLYGPTSLKSTQAFKTLSEECDSAIESMQKILKEKSLKVVEMEFKEHKKKIRTLYCESIHLLATALVKNEPDYKEHPGIRNLVNTVFENEYTTNFVPIELTQQRASQTITDYDSTDLDDDDVNDDAANTLSSKYSKLLFFSCIRSKLPDRKSLQVFFDIYYITIKNMKGYVNQETHKAGDDITASSYLDSLVSSLTGLIKCIFFDSRCEYQAQQQRNSRQAKLQTWVTTAFDEEATATVAMDIDNVNLDSVDMKTLIDTRAQIKINQISKKFDNKIKQMENQLRQQKDRRENANSRSTNKKQKDNKTGGRSPHQKNNRNRNGQKVDDADNASGKDKKKNKNKNSKGKGKKNNKK